jgi:hypothetical protein
LRHRDLKVGIRVKVIANSMDSQFPIGTIGTVTRVRQYYCEVRAKGDWWAYPARDLERYSPSEGE